MRSALLFCCFLLVVGSRGSNPAMRHLLAIDTSGWPTAGNCSTKPDATNDCDKIVDDYTQNKADSTAAEKMRAKMIDIAAKLITGELTYASVNPDLCTSARAYKACVEKTLKDCGNKIKSKVKAKQKSVLLLSNYLQNEVCSKTAIGDKLKSFDFKKCYSSTTLTAADAKKKVVAALGHLKKNGACKAAVLTAKKIMTFYKSTSDDCKNNIGAMANFIARLLVRPDRKCIDKDFKDKPSAADRGNPKSKERVGAQYISLNHHRLNIAKAKTSAKSYITCVDETGVREQVMFEWDFFSVTCELTPASENGVPNTQCRKVCVSIKDDEYNEVANICLDAKNSFEKEGRTIKKGKQKGGGKLTSDISVKANGNNLLKFHDKNSGTLVIIRRISYKNPKGERKYLLIISVRTSKSVMEASSGRLAQACEEVKDIVAAVATSGRRRKRSTDSAVGNYDQKGTGDPEAKDYVSLASSDAESAEAEDNNFSGVSSLVPHLALTILMAVWAM